MKERWRTRKSTVEKRANPDEIQRKEATLVQRAMSKAQPATANQMNVHDRPQQGKAVRTIVMQEVCASQPAAQLVHALRATNARFPLVLSMTRNRFSFHKRLALACPQWKCFQTMDMIGPLMETCLEQGSKAI